MLSPVDRSNRIHALASVIRRAVTDRGGRSSAASKHGRPAAADRSVTSLIERARAIPASHPKRDQLALRLFIEGVLLDEFGNRLATDTMFQTLVDDILTTLEQSAEYGEDCRLLGQMLLGEDGDGR